MTAINSYRNVCSKSARLDDGPGGQVNSNGKLQKQHDVTFSTALPLASSLAEARKPCWTRRVETPAQRVVKVHIIASEALVASMPGPQLTMTKAIVRRHEVCAKALSRAQARAGS